MNRTRITFALGGACLLAFLAPACSSDSKTAATVAPGVSAATDAGGTTADTGAASGGLTISGFAFSAAAVTAGTEFTITNTDSVGHTVTADDGSFDVAVPANGTAKLTIPTAGSFAIHCKIHASMHGTITAA
ncbi:MAG: cupredoxin domain-containing protein [Ilumatobacteraceae bacterium]